MLTVDKNEKDKYIGQDRIVRSSLNFTLKCRSDRPVQWQLPVLHRVSLIEMFRLPKSTHFLDQDLSEYSESLAIRSNVTSSINGQLEHLSILKVTDASYMDTGLYTCRQIGTNHSISQYVYVHGNP